MYGKQTETAIAALSRLAEVWDDGRTRLSAAEIADQRGLPRAMVAKILSALSQANLVSGSPGPGGGYSLARSAELISVADVITAVDAPDEEEVSGDSSWMKSDLWSGLNAKMVSHLQSITLRQLVAEQRAKGVAIEPAPAKVASVKRGVFARKPEPIKITAPNSVFALAGSLAPGRG